MHADVLGEIQSSHRSELDAEGLQKDCEEVREKDDEQELEAISSTSGNIGAVVSRVDVRD